MANIMGDNIWEGPLGVVQLEFDTLDMGKTMEDTTVERDEDVKDILYQQDGTKPADYVKTGLLYLVKAKFAEISTDKLKKIMDDITLSGDGNSVKLGRELYRSLKEYEAKVLKIKRVDSEGDQTANDDYILVFYQAIPIVTGPIEWGADTQRGVEVEFRCVWDENEGAFGYSGVASSVGLNPAA
jgi:hypothetical protein